MIELPSVQIKALREAISRCLAPLPRSRTTPVAIESGPSGLIVRAKNEQAAIEWRRDGDYPRERMVASFDIFKRCSHRRLGNVAFEKISDDSVLARWTDKQIPQATECFGGEFSSDFPPVPETMAECAQKLFAALVAATEVVDTESSRYALECLELRGDGAIGATDGRQALVQQGFAFPWEGELLVRANRIFSIDELASGQPIRIGKSDDWLTLQSGPWTIHLAIAKDVRFPDLQGVLPTAGSEVAVLHLAAADARFFLEAVDRLPASKDTYSPLTIDLNGQVTLCARDPETDRGTAVVLSNSHRSGEMLRYSSNRKFLSRAVKLGFDKIYFPGNEGVAWCRDDRRTYVWMSLAKELAVKQEDCEERIASPTAARSSACASKATSATEPVSFGGASGIAIREESITNAPRVEPVTNGQPLPPRRDASPLSQIESLRGTLTQALSQIGELVSALHKREKRSPFVGTKSAESGSLDGAAA